MGRWLARLREGEKNHQTPTDGTDRTDKTPTAVGFDSFVSPSVAQIQEIPAKTVPSPSQSSVSFVSSASEPVRDFSPPVSPEPEGGFVSSVSSPEERKQDFFFEPDRSGWDGEDWQAAYEERAATLEYDENVPRLEAEALAREWVIAAMERATRSAEDSPISEAR